MTGEVKQFIQVQEATVSGANIYPVVAGSDMGAFIQCGSDRLYTNSVWVEFERPYTGSPIVNLTNISVTGSLAMWIGSYGLNPGSFQALGEGASDEFMWMSMGV